jgi:hypothetical protein
MAAAAPAVGTTAFWKGTTALALPSLSTSLFVGSTLLSAYQSYQQGRAQSAMYDIQALQARAEAERKSLEYELRANDTLRSLRQRNAANLARGYGGGVVGLEGSSKLVETVNNKEAGRDLMFDISNTKNAILQGNTQSEIYNTSANIAMQSGILDAGSKLIMAGYAYNQIGG